MSWNEFTTKVISDDQTEKCLPNWLNQCDAHSQINVSLYVHWPLCNCRSSIELPNTTTTTTKEKIASAKKEKKNYNKKAQTPPLTQRIKAHSPSVGKFRHEFVQRPFRVESLWKDNIWKVGCFSFSLRFTALMTVVEATVSIFNEMSFFAPQKKMDNRISLPFHWWLIISVANYDYQFYSCNDHAAARRNCSSAKIVSIQYLLM